MYSANSNKTKSDNFFKVEVQKQKPGICRVFAI